MFKKILIFQYFSLSVFIEMGCWTCMTSHNSWLLQIWLLIELICQLVVKQIQGINFYFLDLNYPPLLSSMSADLQPAF